VARHATDRAHGFGLLALPERAANVDSERAVQVGQRLPLMG